MEVIPSFVLSFSFISQIVKLCMKNMNEDLNEILEYVQQNCEHGNHAFYYWLDRELPCCVVCDLSSDQVPLNILKEHFNKTREESGLTPHVFVTISHFHQDHIAKLSEMLEMHTNGECEIEKIAIPKLFYNTRECISLIEDGKNISKILLQKDNEEVARILATLNMYFEDDPKYSKKVEKLQESYIKKSDLKISPKEFKKKIKANEEEILENFAELDPLLKETNKEIDRKENYKKTLKRAFNIMDKCEEAGVKVLTEESPEKLEPIRWHGVDLFLYMPSAKEKIETFKKLAQERSLCDLTGISTVMNYVDKGVLAIDELKINDKNIFSNSAPYVKTDKIEYLLERVKEKDRNNFIQGLQTLSYVNKIRIETKVTNENGKKQIVEFSFFDKLKEKELTNEFGLDGYLAQALIDKSLSHQENQDNIIVGIQDRNRGYWQMGDSEFTQEFLLWHNLEHNESFRKFPIPCYSNKPHHSSITSFFFRLHSKIKEESLKLYGKITEYIVDNNDADKYKYQEISKFHYLSVEHDENNFLRKGHTHVGYLIASKETDYILTDELELEKYNIYNRLVNEAGMKPEDVARCIMISDVQKQRFDHWNEIKEEREIEYVQEYRGR